MTLLDGDTRVWLSPSLATAVAHASLQFHTSCPITHDPSEADFIFVGNVNEQPDWSSLRHGEAEFPDLSATVILQVPGIEVVEPSAPNVAPNVAPSSTWELRGPGIEHTRLIRLQHEPEDHWPEARVDSGALPPIKIWRERFPQKYAPLTHAKARLDEKASELSIPLENLISPEIVRRICWNRPLGKVPDALRELGARQWQIELTWGLLEAALHESEPLLAPEPPDAEPAEAGADEQPSAM
jgi:phosphonate C-P lyase system protein PhnH